MLALNMLLQHNRYGVGYHMVITKEENCDSRAVIECVTSVIPGGEMVCSMAHTFSIQQTLLMSVLISTSTRKK